MAAESLVSDVVPFRGRPPSQRATTSFVGMAIFLGAWTVTFAALFFAYADMRLAADVWPDAPVRNWALFWHFVDIVWVVTFVTVYVL